MPYPSISDVLNLVRVFVNDTLAGSNATPGEGRVFTDSAPFIIPMLNASLQAFQRDLENSGVPTMRKEVFIYNVPVITSSGGAGVPDPSVQQYLSFGGFFNGTTFLTGSPPSAPSAGVPSSGGSITAGLHSYKVTFVNTTGETLPSVKSNVIDTTTNKTSIITITAGPSGTTDRKLYRTVAGDTGAWKLLTTVSGNSTLTFTDTIADGSLGADAPSIDTSIPALPADLYVPLRLWARNYGTSTVFTEVFEAQAGLPARIQDNVLWDWDWRGDSIYSSGSTAAKDLRLRYTATVSFVTGLTPPASYPTTYIPFLDCLDALGYRMAYIFCASRLPEGGADSLMKLYQDCVGKITNRQIKKIQRTRFTRPPYGEGNPDSNSTGWSG